jgi:hypothetical protein
MLPRLIKNNLSWQGDGQGRSGNSGTVRLKNRQGLYDHEENRKIETTTCLQEKGKKIAGRNQEN